MSAKDPLPQVSRTGNGRGFTYVELSLVLVLVAMMSFAVVPNLLRMERQREIRRFKAELAAMVGTTRSQALETGDTVALTYDKGDRLFKSILEHGRETTEILRKLDLPDYVEVSRFGADRYESPPDGWRVPFFFDGTTSGGGVEVAIDGQIWSLLVTPGDGRPRTLNAELPDMSTERWKAGTYESR